MSCQTGLKHRATMDRVVVSPDGHGFILAQSRQPFHPWGFNYGNHGLLIEDFWNKDWKVLAADFRKMKSMGANVVRVHLQFGKFMLGRNSPNYAAIRQYTRLLKLAEDTGIYLDVTGLACYRPSDVPEWYDNFDTRTRWDAQANFWRAISRAGAASPAIFCYDLMNEPFVPGGPRKPGDWRCGSLLGGYDFVQFIALNTNKYSREEVARAWIGFLRAAIRENDTNTLITVGMLPWSEKWHFLSGFDPHKCADQLDFISVHIYPDKKIPAEAIECAREFAIGKPLVIEETFPLSCDPPQLEKFLFDSRDYATGWIGHYDGDSLDELDALNRRHKLTISQAIYRSWMQLFVKLRPQFSP
ncbi:MAG: cellulase family glycosylhydrolase [Limisphaerales bacterium]